MALSLNKAGKIVTIEGAKTLAKYAEQNIETIGLENVRVVAGRFQDVLGEVLNESRPVDFAFIDGRIRLSVFRGNDPRAAGYWWEHRRDT